MTHIFSQMENIEKLCPHGWAGPQKASMLAALAIAIRPAIAVEIGVWGGQSALPVALALKELGRGVLYCIDPWEPKASVEGQDSDNAKWWGTIDHELVYKDFLRVIADHGLHQVVKVYRQRSDDVTPPKNIDLLHVDGNHSDQAVKDVERFATNVRVGGYVCLDDLDWSLGGVRRAAAKLMSMGFRELYKLGTGALYQRVA